MCHTNSKFPGFAVASVAALSFSPAAAQRAEIVSFPAMQERVVIDVGRPVADRENLSKSTMSAAMLAQEFAKLAPKENVSSEAEAAIAPRSIISVPNWMRTGRAGDLARDIAPPRVAAPDASPTCSTTPYRPRHDLPAQVELRRFRYYTMMTAAACEAGVPVGLFDALVVRESQYDPRAVSPKGAVGLAQLMPATAIGLGVADRFDPLENMRGGARYLKSHLDAFGHVDLALAAYNAGPGRVRASRRIPPFRETIDYVSAITRAWRAMALRTVTVQSIPARGQLYTFPDRQRLTAVRMLTTSR